jgi:glucose-1-phosphate cytidylyltransferase
LKEKVVILCGGTGTRLREQAEFIPKPMVQIGGRPILWHIMKIYSHYGYDDFILCLGYKGQVIREYFLDYQYMSNDFIVKLNGTGKRVLEPAFMEDWTITCVDTGLDTMTGGRIKRIERFAGERFLATYGDGLSNVDIQRLVQFHNTMGRTATFTAVHPVSRFGEISMDDSGIVAKFSEKASLGSWVSGGFFVFEKRIFDYLDGDESILEREPLETLAQEKQLAGFKHEGAWECMDTYRDYLHLNQLWNAGKAGWKVW